MPSINTNVSALNAQAALAKNSRAMSNAMEQLSTGSRINSANDDAAGMAIGQQHDCADPRPEPGSAQLE